MMDTSYSNIHGFQSLRGVTILQKQKMPANLLVPSAYDETCYSCEAETHRKYLQPGCDADINALPLGARGSGVSHANSGSRIYMRGGCLLSILPNPSKKLSVTVNGTRDLSVLLFGYSIHKQWEIPTASPVNRYRRPVRKTERRC